MSATADPAAESFASDPDDTRAFRALEARYFAAAEWQCLADLLALRLTAPSVQSDPAAAAALHFRRGQILEERCLDRERAVEAYWAVAQLDPAHRGALHQLRRIHARAGEWSVALEIADLEAHIDMPVWERATYLAEIGELWRARLEDLPRARTCFEQALAIDETQLDALTGLARTLEALGDAAAAAQYWQRVVDVQRGPDRATAWIALGRLADGPLQDSARAAECFRRALTDDPRSAEAVEALVGHARANARWPLLADLCERRFDLAAGARRRTAIAVEAAALHLDHLDNPQSARLWLQRAAELSPEDAAVHTLAARIERRSGNQEALLRALEQTARVDPQAGAAARIEAATLYVERGDDERALEHLQAALREACPSGPTATRSPPAAASGRWPAGPRPF